MVFALETIVENFGSEMAPFAVGLCQHLSQAFWRLQASQEPSFHVYHTAKTPVSQRAPHSSSPHGHMENAPLT